MNTTIPRTLPILSLTLLLLSACAAMGFTSSDKKLIKQASFDHGCPSEKVQVLDTIENGMGNASFVLDVCGTERRYDRMGTKYYEKGNEPEPVKQMQG